MRTVLTVWAPLGIVAWVIAYRLGGSRHFLEVVLVSMGVYGVIAWLDRAAIHSPTPRAALRPDLGLLGALLALGAALLAFRNLFGYGAGVATLAGLAVLTALPSAPRDERPLLRGAVTLSLLLVLYRLFAESVAHETNPDAFYQYAALIAGALVPSFLGGLLGSPTAETEPRRSAAAVLVRLGLAGLAAVLLPLALWLTMGERAQGSFLVGLGLGIGVSMARGGEAAPGTRPLARLLAAAMALSAVQFTHLLEPLALLKRTERVGLLAVVAAVVLIGLAVAAWQERQRGRAIIPEGSAV